MYGYIEVAVIFILSPPFPVIFRYIFFNETYILVHVITLYFIIINFILHGLLLKNIWHLTIEFLNLFLDFCSLLTEITDSQIILILDFLNQNFESEFGAFAYSSVDKYFSHKLLDNAFADGQPQSNSSLIDLFGWFHLSK